MIPEAAVEAAAIAHHGIMTGGGPAEWGYLDKQAQDNRLYWMRAALEAAAPHMARVIAGYDDLEDLPVETVIRTNLGTVREKNSLGYWYAMGDEDANGIERLAFPATIIYQP